MSLPVDPTVSDTPPEDFLIDLPSRTAFRRVLIAAGIDIPTDSDRTREQLLDELSQVHIRQAADQVRFAAPQTIHYYRVPDLPHVLAADLEELTATDGFGAQVRAVEELHDRVYVICSVPEDATQTQLSVSEESRVTTVATFDPRTELLAVRAPDADTANGTVRALRKHPKINESDRVSFQNDGFRGRFEDDCVRAYTRYTLGVSDSTASTERIELTAKEREQGDSREDLRNDERVQDLLKRGDTVRRTAHAKIDLSDGNGDGAIDSPSVSLSFVEGSITFRQFVPEATLIRLDHTIRECL